VKVIAEMAVIKLQTRCDDGTHGETSTVLVWICTRNSCYLLHPIYSKPHRSGCHRWHSYPSDSGSYVCGDLGHCSQCPDNHYCQAGKPRSARQHTPSPSAAAQPLTVRVLRIVDGDTINVDIQGRRERVRGIGVNTPETKHPETGREPYGPEASAANRRLVQGRTVRLELDVEQQHRYQRLLTYVDVGELMVNAEIIRQGYAQVATFPLVVDVRLRPDRASMGVYVRPRPRIKASRAYWHRPRSRMCRSWSLGTSLSTMRIGLSDIGACGTGLATSWPSACGTSQRPFV
jgi:endonuclease YncB( thermonuclease family)